MTIKVIDFNGLFCSSSVGGSGIKAVRKSIGYLASAFMALLLLNLPLHAQRGDLGGWTWPENAPMFFGREVDNPSRPNKGLPRVHEHVANVDFTFLAGSSIRAIVFRKSLLEHKGNTLTHNAYGVDSIDKGLRISVEEIAFRKTDHLEL